MAQDEAVATQKTGNTASPSKDYPTPSPYPDWSAMQAYYGPGVLPPTYFAPAIAPGHPPPYMWGPQPMMPPPFGTPYAAVYPHGGAYPHPLVPMMSTPSNVEAAKPANSKEKNSNKKLKEIDRTAVSAGSGNSKRTMSSSEDYSAEGSSDVNDQKVNKTSRKRSSDDGPGAETTTGANTECVLAPNHTLGNGAILPHHCFPTPVIKPSATNVANSSVIGTAISPSPGVMVPAHTALASDLSVKDERELKREKRKQSNRESARRSRLRKQAETEELATQVESLTAENTSLRSEIGRLTQSSEKLRLENSALMVKLKDTAALTPAEPSPNKAAASSSSPRAAAENFLSMIDSTNALGASRHTEHGEPKLRQLLDSSPATDVAAMLSKSEAEQLLADAHLYETKLHKPAYLKIYNNFVWVRGMRRKALAQLDSMIKKPREELKLHQVSLNSFMVKEAEEELKLHQGSMVNEAREEFQPREVSDSSMDKAKEEWKLQQGSPMQMD